MKSKAAEATGYVRAILLSHQPAVRPPTFFSCIPSAKFVPRACATKGPLQSTALVLHQLLASKRFWKNPACADTPSAFRGLIMVAYAVLFSSVVWGCWQYYLGMPRFFAGSVQDGGMRGWNVHQPSAAAPRVPQRSSMQRHASWELWLNLLRLVVLVRTIYAVIYAYPVPVCIYV